MAHSNNRVDELGCMYRYKAGGRGCMKNRRRYIYLEVASSGNCISGSTVEFPGAYQQEDESFNLSIWNGINDNPMPAPEVWTGGDGGNNTNLWTRPTPLTTTV